MELALTIGGHSIDRFDPQEAWYPVHYVGDLDRQKPTPFTLLDQDLVIWWDRQHQTWRSFLDRCPHRLASLSEGRINESGQLECPYHGWAFNGSGECEYIPQQLPNQKAETSSRACVRDFPTKVSQGLLFIYPGNPDNAEHTKVPIIPALEENQDGWVCLNTFRDLPYDAITLMENVLDPSHLPYTHHKTVGNRSNAGPVELEITSSSREGFTGTWAEGPRKGKLGKQDTTFVAPNLMWHELISKQLGRTLTVVYATPIRKGECRLFARFPFKFSSKLPAFFIKITPQWYSHLSQNNILEDDQIFLHHQERWLEKDGGGEEFTKAFYLPTKADLFVFEYRQWINQYQADPFPHQTLPPALNKTQLLDRYHSHTKNCASCQQALRRLKLLRIALGIIVALSWATVSLMTVWGDNQGSVGAIATIILTLVSGGIWYKLGELIHRFYQGKEIPPRNLTSTSNR
jgi:phenylpropionate dioxygenase-like ring-hydroxylating dioxygenase large terminal subunit